jgi:hypothetical protein
MCRAQSCNANAKEQFPQWRHCFGGGGRGDASMIYSAICSKTHLIDPNLLTPDVPANRLLRRSGG